ncbi:MAG: DCC1-like thiol-disulfide oxidoreductase family protein [Gammaproteobacteria bacterium]|nr:DCC1-like thiol-disulfide oxidoreductase family protein [Gammaproteobacteria bacterium]
MSMSALRVYYDGLCPLCTKEINHIKRLDTRGLMDMQDINAGSGR